MADYRCSRQGENTGRNLPADDLYYLTTFGGGADAQHTACGPVVDGSWFYIAGSHRFGCGTHVRVVNPRTGASCIAEVVDDGPACWVEDRAGGPIIDASPMVVQHLFGVRHVGWSDRWIVKAWRVGNNVPLGPFRETESNLPWIVAVLAGAGIAFLWSRRHRG